MSFPKIRSRDQVLAEIETETTRELATARATIRELEKRIGELEVAWDQLTKRHAEALTDLTAERQRREECEAALRLQLDESVSGLDAENAAKAYFRKYEPPSESDNPPKVAG